MRTILSLLVMIIAVVASGKDKSITQPLAYVNGVRTHNGVVVFWVPTRFPVDWKGMVVKRRKAGAAAWRAFSPRPIRLCGTSSIDWEAAVPAPASRKVLRSLLKKKVDNKADDIQWDDIVGIPPRKVLVEDGRFAYRAIIQSDPVNSLFVGLGCFDSVVGQYEYGVFEVLGKKTSEQPVGIWRPRLDLHSPELAISGVTFGEVLGSLSLTWKVRRKTLEKFGVYIFQVSRSSNGKDFRPASRVAVREADIVGDSYSFRAIVPASNPKEAQTFKVVPGDIIERYRMRPTVLEYKPVKK